MMGKINSNASVPTTMQAGLHSCLERKPLEEIWFIFLFIFSANTLV